MENVASQSLSSDDDEYICDTDSDGFGDDQLCFTSDGIPKLQFRYILSEIKLYGVSLYLSYLGIPMCSALQEREVEGAVD